MVMFLEFYMIMVIWNMVIFLKISKYGNIAYGNVFRNYYHIWIPKYGKKKKTYALGEAKSQNQKPLEEQAEERVGHQKLNQTTL